MKKIARMALVVFLVSMLTTVFDIASVYAVSSLFPPSTIRVLITATGEIKVVNFEDYVKNVLPNEWYASWPMEALKAGAMAVKTYAWYWTIHQKYPGKGYNVKDSTADQVYIPGSSNSRTNQAVDDTWNYYMTKNSEIFQAQYDSGTEGSPDPLNPGRMSQWGTQYWALQARTWQWIVHYYYDPVEIDTIVGGVVVSVDKFDLLAPYIGLSSTILAATVTTVVFIKRRRER